jgi:integrase
MQGLLTRQLGEEVAASAARLGLLATAQTMLESAVASSTQGTYSVGVKRYRKFCVELGLSAVLEAFVPPVEYVLVLFVISMTKAGIQSSTQRVYIASVHSYARLRAIPTCVAAGGTYPPLLSALLVAAQRIYAASPAAAAAKAFIRLPVTTSMMKKMLIAAPLVLSGRDAARFRCIILMLFLNCLRCGEVLTPVTMRFDPAVHLNRADVHIDGASGQPALLISIKQSKTDQFRKGRLVACFNQAGSVFAVIGAWVSWVHARSAILGSDRSGPMFVSESGSAFSTVDFRAHLNIVCAKAGLPLAQVKPHSFRRGAATVLAAAGVEDSALQNFGFWRSDAFRAYVVEARQTRMRLQNILTTSTL